MWCCIPSDEESAIVAAAEPGVVARTLLPYSFADFASPRPPAAEPVILFVGGFAHLPNRHGVFWFVDQVLPLIRARVPAARFAIVGSNPPPDVLALAGDAISVRANVSDAELRELYRTARVAAVPLRYGAGVKLKVVEALREGLPLVTTSIGAQGVPGLESVAAICDEPQAFADAVCRLLTDGIAVGRAVDGAGGVRRGTLFRGGVSRQPRCVPLAQSAQPLRGAAGLVVGARRVHLRARRNFRHADIPPMPARCGG